MAYYFHNMLATENVSPALDASTEVATFISTYVKDWATKCGSDYVVYHSGHDDWVTNTSGTTTALRTYFSLVGPPERAGTDPNGENMGFYFKFDNYIWYYTFRGWTSNVNSNNGTGDVRDYDQFFWTSSDNLVQSYTYDAGTNDCLVWYSDTPGNRYFAWNLLWNSNNSGIITEMNDVSHVPLEENYGWAHYGPTNWKSHPIVRSEESTSSSNINPWVSSGDLAPGMPTPSTTTSHWFHRNLVTRSTVGAYMGHAGDTILASGFEGQPLSAINFDGSQYVCIGNNYWVKTS